MVKKKRWEPTTPSKAAAKVAKKETKGAVERPSLNVTIQRKIWEQMTQWGSLNSPDECGLFLDVETVALKDGGLVLEVHGCTATEQQVAGSTVEFDEAEQMAWLKEKKLWPGLEHGEFPVWGIFHTHPGFGVFWSGTDEATLVKNQMGNGLLLNIVHDPDRGTVLARLDHKVRYGTGINDWLWAEWGEVPVEIQRPVYDGVEAWLEEATEKVSALPSALSDQFSTEAYDYGDSWGENDYWDHHSQSWKNRNGQTLPSKTARKPVKGAKSVKQRLYPEKQMSWDEIWELSCTDKAGSAVHLLTVHGTKDLVQISSDDGYWVESQWNAGELTDWWGDHFPTTDLKGLGGKSAEFWMVLMDHRPIRQEGKVN